MSKKTIKINTRAELFKEFRVAKAELGAETSEETLALLLLRCSQNGVLERLNEEALEEKIQDGLL